MARRVRAHDWASTPLGPIERWPHALRVAADVCLNNRLPMMLWWGRELTFIYNDAYAPMLGNRHPAALGRCGRDVWADIWPVIGPQVDAVLRRGEATYHDRVRLVTDRSGYPEEAWFTWSYSPIPDDDGGIGGVFGACREDTRQVLAERERDALASQRQLALDAAKMGWWRYDAATNSMTWDGRFAEMLDLPGPGAAIELVLARVHPDDLALVRDAAGPAMDPVDPRPYAVQFRIRRGDGAERWIETHGTANFEGAGETRQLISFTGAVTDVTDRKLAEERLTQSNERLDLAQRAAGIGVFDWDVATGRLVWTEEEERLFGLPPGTFEGTTDGWAKRVLPADLPVIQHALSAAMERRELETDFAFHIVRENDGAVRWIEGRGRFFYDEAGRPLRMVGVNVDATDRRRAADRVGRLYAIAAALSEARSTADVARVAVEQGVTAVGAAAGSLLLLSEDGAALEIAGAVGYPADVVERWRRIPTDSALPLTDAIRSGEPVYLSDPGDRTARYPALAAVAPALDMKSWACVPLLIGGKAVGVLGLSFDQPGAIVPEDRDFVAALTRQCAQALERARLFEAERRARAEAERASDAKSEFIAALSHELRTPLTPVLLTVSLLETHAGLPEELRGDVTAMRRNVELECRLIGDLLDLTRIAKGKVQLEQHDVDLHAAVRAALDICRPEASSRLVTELRATDPTVRGDPTRLQQIFWNLLNNAIKFTPADGTITVRSSDAPAGGHVVVEVIDTGAGIDPDVLPRLFNAFEQGDTRTGRAQAGLGLGLAISRKLAEAHGGTIVARSAGRGRGATFTVELPTVQATATPAPPSHPPQVIRTHEARPIAVLLVEDHEPTLNVMSKLLRGMGHHVSGATTVAAAIQAATDESFDVIVCDIGLPDGSGLEVARALRDRYPGRAIALTGYGMDSDVAASLEAGFAEHITKPVDLASLQAAVMRVAGRNIPSTDPGAGG